MRACHDVMPSDRILKATSLYPRRAQRPTQWRAPFVYSGSVSSRIRFRADLASHSRAFCRSSAALRSANFSLMRIWCVSMVLTLISNYEGKRSKNRLVRTASQNTSTEIHRCSCSSERYVLRHFALSFFGTPLRNKNDVQVKIERF
jgi:hypothetical protein